MHGAAAEVTDLGGQAEGGEVAHGKRDLESGPHPLEDPTLEPAGQPGGDPMCCQRGHLQPAARMCPVDVGMRASGGP